MLRLSSKADGCKDFWKPSKPCHVGIHGIALAEHSQVNTHEPGFQSFFRLSASFCIDQISGQPHKGKVNLDPAGNRTFRDCEPHDVLCCFICVYCVVALILSDAMMTCDPCVLLLCAVKRPRRGSRATRWWPKRPSGWPLTSRWPQRTKTRSKPYHYYPHHHRIP